MKMKKILLILLPALILVSCEKNYLVPGDEVPGWLKDRISDTEKEIRKNPHSGLDISAWIRYSYDNEYYFEYHNLLSSSFPPIYNYRGDMMTFSWDSNDAYQKDKCCKEYIWKGPSWSDAYNGW